jgi:hypothetical protein
MAVATGGVIAAAVVIITAGAEAEAITMVGGTIATGKGHYCPEIGVGWAAQCSDPQSLALPDGQNPPHAGQSIGSPIF